MIVRRAAEQAVFHPEKMGKADLAAMERLFVGLNAFEPGQRHKLHVHAGQDKLYFVMAGEGDVTVEEKTARIREGDLVALRAGEEHSLANPGTERLVVMVVMAPPPSGKG